MLSLRPLQGEKEKVKCNYLPISFQCIDWIIDLFG